MINVIEKVKLWLSRRQPLASEMSRERRNSAAVRSNSSALAGGDSMKWLSAEKCGSLWKLEEEALSISSANGLEEKLRLERNWNGRKRKMHIMHRRRNASSRNISLSWKKWRSGGGINGETKKSQWRKKWNNQWQPSKWQNIINSRNMTQLEWREERERERERERNVGPSATVSSLRSSLEEREEARRESWLSHLSLK